MNISSLARLVFSLVGLAALTRSASAQAFVNFADPGAPVELTAFFYVGTDSPNYITGENPGELADSDLVNFNGSAAIAGGGNLGFTLSLYDDGMKDATPELVSQMSFYVSNYSGQSLFIAAESLRFGLSGLYALGGTLDGTFAYTPIVYGADPFDFGLVSQYDPETGSFFLTNSEAFEIPTDVIVLFIGTFGATPVPEPAAWATLMGGGVLGFVLMRRGRRAA